MAIREAVQRLRLDTKPMKKDLDRAVKDAEAKGKKIRKKLRDSVGKGLGAIGMGGGIGAGMAAFRGATQSGVGDVIGESFSTIGAALNEFFLGDLDDQSRAKRRAREETIDAFGYQAGATGSIPAGARQFFDNRVAEYTTEELGRSRFEQDAAFAGPRIDEIIGKITDALRGLLSDAVNALAERLTFWE